MHESAPGLRVDGKQRGSTPTVNPTMSTLATVNYLNVHIQESNISSGLSYARFGYVETLVSICGWQLAVDSRLQPNKIDSQMCLHFKGWKELKMAEKGDKMSDWTKMRPLSGKRLWNLNDQIFKAFERISDEVKTKIYKTWNNQIPVLH